MFKQALITITLVLTLAVGWVAWSYLKPADAPSAAIEAMPIEVESGSTETVSASTENAETSAVVESESATEAVTAPVNEVVSSEASESTGSESGGEMMVFEIEQSSSEARFYIEEVLRGSPFTVVGTTDQVAGQIAVDPSNPATAQLGTILINARDFATDSDNRDNAIKNEILQTNTYEYITFTPTSIAGLPESVAEGESVTFQVTGDLTMLDQTHPVTFEITLTPVSDSEMTGSATATILYSDWGIQIPEVPMVTGVEDEVVLELAFTATPAA
jgi:polyisoprenoid-binding protein YceI